ncbi:hypothetical protein ACP4OV_014727 [Aristida adscensionis]
MHQKDTNNIALININDPRTFYSFNVDAANKLVNEGQFLQYFNVQVKPCSVNGKEPQNKEVELYTNIQRLSAYHDVHYVEAISIVPMMKLQPRQRHVEISAKNQYPNGLRHLLSVTNTIFITDDDFVRCLTDLNYIMFQSEMSKWKKLFVRGCPSLQCLPLLKKQYPKPKVKVSGERDWCDKLQLIPEQYDYYKQMPSLEFASRKKSVIIKSYLR